MGNILKFITKNWLWLILGSVFLVLFVVVIIFSILWGDTHDFDRWLRVSQDDQDDCINGEFCPFCSTECICEFGWKGKHCNQKNYTGTFYPVNWWDMESMECFNQGVLSEEACMTGCENDDQCKGYTWNPCETELPSCCIEPAWPCLLLRREIEELPTCCTGESPNPSCCIPQCKHIKNFNGFDKPAFLTMYERSNEMVIYRRSIEDIPPPVSQRILYVKNGAKCFGYLCTYNEEYGLVWTDDFMHSQVVETIDEIIHDALPTWNENGDWQGIVPETMGDYSKLPSKLGDVLEITELPFLQMKKLFETTTPKIDSMTVACSRSTMYTMMTPTDYHNWTYDGKSLIQIKKDYSLEFLEPGEIPKKYDTIILTMPMYMRKSLPRLLTNAFNLLKDGGHMITRTQFWPFVNSTVVTNYCMAAGMAKWKFASEFGALFTPVHFKADPMLSEPCVGSCDSPEPMPFKNTECWAWYPGFYHPEHVGQWFSFIGKK